MIRTHYLFAVSVLTAGLLGAQDFPRVLLPQDAATVDGNTATSFPWNVTTPTRVMMAYGADMLSSAKPMRITGLAFRRDATVPSHGAAQFGIRIEMSTCRNPADNLDRTFDNNHGADRAAVFSAVHDIHPVSAGTAPHGFSIRIDFEQPFTWDPACGPLLVDLRSSGLTSGRLIGVTDGTTNAPGTFGRIAQTTNLASPTANYPTTGTQRFVPAVSLLVDASTAPSSVAAAEANSSSNFPWNRPNGTEMRVQQIYAGSITGLTGDHRIHSLAWRTDAGRPFSGGRTYSMRVTLSTGAVGLAAAPSTSFSGNTGSDAKIVFEGDWTPSASSSTLPTSACAQRLDLQRSFDYRPASGPLVVDIQLFNSTGSTVTPFDGVLNTGVGVARVFDRTNAAAQIGTTQDFALAMRIGSTRHSVLPVAFDSGTNVAISSFSWNAPVGQRALYAYSGAGLGQCRPILIERLSWIPQGQLGPVGYTATIDLSTGRVPVDGLTTRFDLNHGADRTRAFDGRISAGRVPPEGPAKFSLSVELDRPFLWDPANGPLIVDLRTPGGPAAGSITSPFFGMVSGEGYRVVHRDDPDAFNADYGPQNFALALRLGGDTCKRALAFPFGDGCPSLNGVPVNAVSRLPQTGELDFAFELHDGPRSQQVSMLTGTVRQATNLGFVGLPACDLEIIPNFISLSTVTDAAGHARFAWPVPVEPSYDGITLFTQWLCLDNSAPGGATVSPGLEVVFCHR